MVAGLDPEVGVEVPDVQQDYYRLQNLCTHNGLACLARLGLLWLGARLGLRQARLMWLGAWAGKLAAAGVIFVN